MRTHKQIIVDAGGYRSLAERLGMAPERVRFWAMRKSIPADCWKSVSEGGLATLDELAEAAAKKSAANVDQASAA